MIERNSTCESGWCKARSAMVAMSVMLERGCELTFSRHGIQCREPDSVVIDDIMYFNELQ